MNQQYRLPFGMQCFRALIINTFDEWSGYEKLKNHMDDYLQAVNMSDLENSIGRFLESNSFNQLTIETMPLIDLGDKPASFDPNSSESG
jgi:hypothetical protein